MSDDRSATERILSVLRWRRSGELATIPTPNPVVVTIYNIAEALVENYGPLIETTCEQLAHKCECVR